MSDSTREDGTDTAATNRARRDGVADKNAPSAFRFERATRAYQDNEGVPELLRDLVKQGSHLAEQQTKLVQAEVRAAVSQLTAAAGAMAGAAVLAIAGLGVLLMGVSFLLARALPLWLATLLVAAATMILAYAMFSAGRRKIDKEAFDMPRTRHTLDRAPAAIAAKTDEGRDHVR